MSYNVKDFKNMYYGVELASQIERFRKGLKAIEKNHINYLSCTPLLHRKTKPNQLRFHYSTYINGKIYGFGILNDSDLRADIICECFELFAKVFIPKSK